MTHVLDYLTFQNRASSRKIKIGYYVIATKRPNKSRTGKVTKSQKTFLFVTPDDFDEAPFLIVEHNFALLLKNIISVRLEKALLRNMADNNTLLATANHSLATAVAASSRVTSQGTPTQYILQRHRL